MSARNISVCLQCQHQTQLVKCHLLYENGNLSNFVSLQWLKKSHPWFIFQHVVVYKTVGVMGCQKLSYCKPWPLPGKTRRLCYHKDDHAMCPICPQLLFPTFFMGFCSNWPYEYFLQNLKTVALPISEIIGVPQKIGHSLDMPTLPFLQSF